MSFSLTAPQQSSKDLTRSWRPKQGCYQQVWAFRQRAQDKRPVSPRREPKRFSASLISLGSNFYKAEFSSETVPGKTYTCHWEYTIDRDITGNSRQGTRDFGWAPIQWSVPIEKIIVQIVLPIELSSSINKPEQVTDAIVGATGLQTNESNKSNFDRFIFFPTPDERTGKNYLSIHAEKDNAIAEEKAYLELFFPEKYFTSQTNPPEKEEKNFFINIVAGIDDDTRMINIMNVDPRWLGSGNCNLSEKSATKQGYSRMTDQNQQQQLTYFLLDNDSLEPGRDGLLPEQKSLAKTIR